MASVIAYIDGFNLYHGLRDKYGHRYLWLDIVKLATRLRPHDTIIAVRYFTAMVRDDPQAEFRQRTYLAALDALDDPRLTIIKGRYQAKSLECRQCGTTWTSYEEKETDVNIAASLVADVATARADLGLLVSADSDLCPAIRTARDIAGAKNDRFGIVAAFPPKRFSNDIKRLVPGAFTISRANVRNSLLPDCVTDAHSGRKYHRPAKWR